MPLACMHPPPTSRSCNACKLGGWRPSPPSKTCSSAETRCYWTPSVNDHPLRPAFRRVPCSRPAAPTRSCVHGHGLAAAFLTLQTRPLQLTLAAAGRGRAPPCGFVLTRLIRIAGHGRPRGFGSYTPSMPPRAITRQHPEERNGDPSPRTRKGYLMHPQP